MVVVPTMITNGEGVDRLLETLEIHHLANRDPNLHFALLTDFRDAAAEAMPEDAELLARIRQGVESLNRKYPSGDTSVFLSVSPAAALESRRRPVDGIRAEAGKADGVQLPAPWRLARVLFRNRRAIPASCPPSSMSSRSTPTPSCRAIPPGSSSARWPIR